MVKVKVLKSDVKTGKSKVVEKDIKLPKFEPMEKSVVVDLRDLEKLLEYAKSKGWI